MFFYGFDLSYFILVLPAFLFSLWASARVRSTFGTYENVKSKRGITAHEAAQTILQREGLSHVQIEHIAGTLSDHYDPGVQRLRLSDPVYDSHSLAAIGVSAHEVGHALQHATGYAPLRLRNALVPICSFGAKLATPLFLFGFLLSLFDSRYLTLAYVGVIAFGLAVLFQLITLPTEFDASKRALLHLQKEQLLTEDELPAAKKVLSAAALTYIAGLAVSLAQLARLLFLLGRRR